MDLLVGDFLLIGIEGFQLDAEDQRLMNHPAVAGVVLFKRNFENYQQLKKLIAEIRATRNRPLLISVDQEGGRVQRFKKGFTQLPALSKIGELWEDDSLLARKTSYHHGRLMALELVRCGVDLSFAPVVDLKNASEVIGDRAFHANPIVVTQLAEEYITGMHDAGMASVIKHFPGHASVIEDSHRVLPKSLVNLSELELRDLKPFKALARKAKGLMAAHILYPNIDSHVVGFSSYWLKNYLRQELGFAGSVFGDDLGMQGAVSCGSIFERVVQCLSAGCDFALMCDPKDALEVLQQLTGEEADSSINALLAQDAIPLKTDLFPALHQESLSYISNLVETIDS